ncbi:MAG TPA: YbaB/EbfC family nucleoid-associated protein [Amycolatopsis sp.]|uniref:YbaB/EbfC family nucleoid-associated protein n=1 Tax=Flexivirga sp. TaxID=1962927 RepID=UPI002BBABED1|nr:YbaB/EbfC family nucleoid-associated protein [Flexivirga sp.]HWC20714.1 YbaB/EbfC family nucleoid-associated protein [Flexivirga sp.]HWD05336.1 YbaB/EbfC family nucleoid-associated protein [Amycolatopsis sp.]
MSTDDELYNLAREINDAVATIQSTVKRAATSSVEVRLPGDLGTVTVTGAGELQRIDLDPDEVRNYTTASLARQLLAGIHQAEHDAARQRAATVADAIAKEHLR